MSTLNRIERGYKDRVRKAIVRVKAADLTAAAHSQAIAAGSIPPEAVVLGYKSVVAEAFTDGAGATFTADLGDGTTADKIASAVAFRSTGKAVPAAGLSVLVDGGTWTITVKAGVNVNTATAGDATVTIFYIV